MASTSVLPQPLVIGERISVFQFEERWNGMSGLKQAELIDGIVFVPLPVGTTHGWLSALMIGLLGNYASPAPGTRTGNSRSWRMLESTPQPDAYFMVLPE